MADYIPFVTAAAAFTAAILLGVIAATILASRTSSQKSNALHWQSQQPVDQMAYF